MAVVPLDLRAGPRQSLGERVERRVVIDGEPRMGLARGREQATAGVSGASHTLETTFEPRDTNDFDILPAVEAIKQNIQYLHKRVLGEG